MKQFYFIFFLLEFHEHNVNASFTSKENIKKSNTTTGKSVRDVGRENLKRVRESVEYMKEKKKSAKKRI